VNTTSEGSGRIPPEKYAGDLKASGVRGFSVYLGEVMSAEDYRAFGAAAG
jgi:hypothetical protein